MADEPAAALPPLIGARSRWTLTFRAIGAASDPRCLILAALGLASLNAGFAGLGLAFGDAPWLAPRPSGRPGLPDAAGEVVGKALGLFGPFIALFRADVSALGRVQAALGSAWVLAVWGLFGGAIARVAAVRVATGGRVGVVSALKFSLARLGSLIAAPASPLAVAGLFGLFGAAVGLLDRIPGTIGRGLATVLAFVPLGVGLLDAVILLGLALAWPLMVATVVVEGEDFFDAISRSYSYVNQRGLHYAGMVLLAAALGAVGLVLVGLFAGSALGLADWSVSLGAPRDVGFRFLDPTTADASGAPAVGHFWVGAVGMVVDGWAYSYLWSSAAIVYLVLRRDVDGSDVHDIYMDEHEADAFIPDEEAAETEPMPGPT